MHNVLSKNMPRFSTNEALITIVPSNAAWPNEPKLDRYQLWKALYNDCSKLSKLFMAKLRYILRNLSVVINHKGRYGKRTPGKRKGGRGRGNEGRVKGKGKGKVEKGKWKGREGKGREGLPHFGIICLVKPKMNSPLKFLRKMLKLIFLELLIMIYCKLTTLTVLHVFQESLNLHLSFPLWLLNRHGVLLP
jgi:hypothetical protein